MSGYALALVLIQLAQAASVAGDSALPIVRPPVKSSTGRSSYGILLLAHGGSPSWNEEVLKIREELEAGVPAEVAFGMADSGEIRKAVGRLESRGAAKIVAVPLFVNSSSEVMDQTRYVLGLAEKPSEVFQSALERAARGNPGGHPHSGHAHHPFSLERVRTRLPLVLTAALDDHPLVAGVLLERARALSRDPGRETVILVGHGPVDEAANHRWLEHMERLARAVQREGGFRAARAATIRDDSAQGVKAVAAQMLRGMVGEAREGGGRVIVVPYLIARGGIEEHIVGILEGLDYSWDGKTLCPHPHIARWIAESAARGSGRQGMRRFP